MCSRIIKTCALFDIGDIVAVQGLVGKTQAGEISIFVDTFQIITKTIRPLLISGTDLKMWKSDTGNDIWILSLIRSEKSIDSK